MDNMLYRRVFFIPIQLMKFKNLCHRKDRNARKKEISNKNYTFYPKKFLILNLIVLIATTVTVQAGKEQIYSQIAKEGGGKTYDGKPGGSFTHPSPCKTGM